MQVMAKISLEPNERNMGDVSMTEYVLLAHFRSRACTLKGAPQRRPLLSHTVRKEQNTLPKGDLGKRLSGIA